MTDEMREWFHHLATVEQEIRYDIERYETQHVTPGELGVRIRTHPKLAITAAAKMRTRHARTTLLLWSPDTDHPLQPPRPGMARPNITRRPGSRRDVRARTRRHGPAGDHGHGACAEREHPRVSRPLSLPREQPRSRRQAHQPVHPTAGSNDGELTGLPDRGHGTCGWLPTSSARSTSGSTSPRRLHQPRTAQGGRRRHLRRHQVAHEP